MTETFNFDEIFKDPPLRKLSELTHEEQKQHALWLAFKGVYKNRPKWDPERNELAYDLMRERLVRDGKQLGIPNPKVIFRRPRGERQDPELNGRPLLVPDKPLQQS